MRTEMEVLKKGVFPGHKGSVYTIERSFEKNKFVTAGGDGIIAEWDFDNTEVGKPLAMVNKVVYSIKLDISTGRLFAGQAEGGIHVIDLHKNKETRLLQYHNAPIFNMAINNDFEIIVSLDGSGELGISALEDLSLIKKLKISEGKLRCVVFSNNNL